MPELTPALQTPPAPDTFRSLVEAVEDYALYVLDCAGNVMTWNRGAELNKGYRADEVLGRHFRMFFLPEDVEANVPEQELQEAMTKGRSAGEAWRLRKDGQRFWASYTLTVMRDEQHRHIGFAKVTRDLTERKRHEDALRSLQLALKHERDTFLAAAESHPEALLICSAVRDAQHQVDDFVFTFLNANASAVLGSPRTSLLGGRMKHLATSVRALHLFEPYKQVLDTGVPLTMEVQTNESNPASRWLRIQATKLRDGLLITASDITERKQDEAEATHLANHDPLTGVLNRNQLKFCIEHACAHAIRHDYYAGCFLLDLDGFKQVNDRFGHVAGDELLKIITGRLRSTLRASDSIIRIGGDEFMVICEGAHTLTDLRWTGQLILKAVREPILQGEHSLCVTASLGLATCRGDLKSPEQLLAEADAAMYTAKKRGKNQLEIYASGEVPGESEHHSKTAPQSRRVKRVGEAPPEASQVPMPKPIHSIAQ